MHGMQRVRLANLFCQQDGSWTREADYSLIPDSITAETQSHQVFLSIFLFRYLSSLEIRQVQITHNFPTTYRSLFQGKGGGA